MSPTDSLENPQHLPKKHNSIISANKLKKEDTQGDEDYLFLPKVTSKGKTLRSHTALDFQRFDCTVPPYVKKCPISVILF